MSFPRTFLVVLVLLISTNALAQEKRVALVIGNSKYSKEVGMLPNPVNDATDMASQLKNSGFEVQLITDATYAQMREAVKQFYDKLSAGPKDQVVGLFYYAGHGLQYQNENYLVPVDAAVQYEDDIARLCLPVQRVVLSNMQRANSRMNIIILDACRNNPFPATTRALGNGGLGEMADARGSFVAYATAPGSVASDGAGKNGLYTQELLKAMNMPGLLIEQVFKEVRRNVLHLSGEKQYTWDSSNILGDFYFIPGNQPAPVVIARADPPPSAIAKNEAKREMNVVVTKESLEKELTALTNQSIPFKDRQVAKERVLKYFVVPYAKVYTMIGPRIDERLTASKLLDRLVTLPESTITITAIENSDSGRIVELSLEIE
ncbi:MAG TPA: caspase family protein [Cyclobacteriaceae bacterium]|nr:caspase family protein [Cyclobacteriaceae bacterium]